MTTGTDDRKEMTSTTQVPLSVEGLAEWLRNGKLGICAAHPAQLDTWADAVESLAAERIAPEGQAQPVAWMWQHEETGNTGFVRHASEFELRQWERMNRPRKIVTPLYAAPQAAQSEMMDTEIDALFAREHSPQDKPWTNWRRFARAILSARKDRAEALLWKAAEALNAMQTEARARNCGLKICDDALAAIRNYLKGEAP